MTNQQIRFSTGKEVIFVALLKLSFIIALTIFTVLTLKSVILSLLGDIANRTLTTDYVNLLLNYAFWLPASFIITTQIFKGFKKAYKSQQTITIDEQHKTITHITRSSLTKKTENILHYDRLIKADTEIQTSWLQKTFDCCYLKITLSLDISGYYLQEFTFGIPYIKDPADQIAKLKKFNFSPEIDIKAKVYKNEPTYYNNQPTNNFRVPDDHLKYTPKTA